MSATRSTLLTLHRWVGLALFALLLVQGLSGAILVFRDPLERLIHPVLTAGSPQLAAPVQVIIDSARSAYPDHRLRRIDFPNEPGQAAIAELDGEQTVLVAIDGAGQILRTGGLEQWPLRWLFELHHALLAGELGETIVGIEGIALIFLAITGPIVWWPGIKRWRNGFRLWRGRGAQPLLRSLHRAGGAAIAIVLLFSAVTGTAMVFKDSLRDVLEPRGLTIDKPAPKVAARPGAVLLPVDALISRARATYGPERLQQLRFPGGTGRVVAVYLDEPDSARPNASKQIWFDGYSGEQLGAYLAGEVPAGNEAIDWLFPLHTGAAGGILLMIVIMFGGIGLAALAASGLYLWAVRRFGRRASARKSLARNAVSAI